MTAAGETILQVVDPADCSEFPGGRPAFSFMELPGISAVYLKHDGRSPEVDTIAAPHSTYHSLFHVEHP
jgi:hypothetical protein